MTNAPPKDAPPRNARAGWLAAAGGVVFAAATPPLDFRAAILLGLVLFALAAKLAMTRRGAAWSGFGFGLTANLLALRFVPEVLQRFTPLPTAANWLALLLLAAAQAVPWALGGLLGHWLAHPGPEARRKETSSWLAFAVTVYVATWLPAVFPWSPAGGLAEWPVLLQSAELIGERGTSVLLAVACGLVADGLLRLWRRGDAHAVERGGPIRIALGAMVLAMLVVYGMIRTRAVEAIRRSAPHARIALLQPDFDAMSRWEEHRATMMLDRLRALTRRAEADGAILTVWPESAYPYTLAHGTKNEPPGHRALLQEGVKGPVLTGAYLTKGGGVGTNSAILVDPSGAIGPSYDKRHLLWFGETIPFADTFPVLRRIFARGTGIVPGTESTVFRTGPIAAAVLNCYEDTLPVAGREAMSGHPNLLINITNDAWFAGSAEGELHLRLSVLRAIEARRDLVRAVNRGPTSWVDATGRIRMRSGAVPGLGPSPPLLVDAALIDAPPTLYTRAGEIPIVMALLLAIVLPSVRTRTRKADGEQTS